MAMSLRMTVLRLAALTAGCCLGCGQTALPAGDVGAQASTRPASRACTYRVETQRLGELPRRYRGALPGPGWRRSAIVVREQGPPRQEYVVVDGGAAHPKYDRVGDERCGGIRFSRDGLHLAYTARRGRQAFVVVDGQAGPGWRGVREPTLGAGGRIAHAAHDGTGWRIVVDGRAGPRWDKVYRVQFSPDGRRLARFVRSGAVCQLLLDDQAGLTFQLPRRTPFFCFSPDSRRWACNARQNGRDVLVLDGKVIPVDGPILSHKFERKSMRHVCIVDGGPDRHGWRQILLVDGRKVREGGRIKRVEFSSDGSHVAWLAHYDNGKGGFWADGQEKHLFRVWDPANGGRPMPKYLRYMHWDFSPDGSRLACTVRLADGRERMMIDGRKGPIFESVSYPRFSSDGKRVLYLAGRHPDYRVIVDGRLVACERARYPAFFTPDGRHAIVNVERGGRRVVLRDGEVLPGLSHVGSIRTGGDPRREAWVHYESGEACVILDGRRGRPYKRVLPLVFSADGRHVAYVGRRDGKCHVVVDEQEGPPFDELGAGDQGSIGDMSMYPELEFGPDGTLEYLARRDGVLYRFRHAPAGGDRALCGREE